jgi:hypothetical protein
MVKTGYQRLTRASARGIFAVAVMSRTSLWLGEDHLLFVESSGYTEKYKRFYFRDIQTLMVQHTPIGHTLNILFAIFLVLTMIFGLLAQNTGWRIFFFIFVGIFGLALVINLFKGQTCNCFLRTAVQIEELPPLRRVRRAQKIFARIHPLIAAAQGGELSAEMISAQMHEPASSAAADATVSETTGEAATTIASAETPNPPPKLNS